jgi:lipopolysaccharide biosynthesis glycosyltransferase
MPAALGRSKIAIVCCVTPNWAAQAAVTLLSAVRRGGVGDCDLLILIHKPTAKDFANLERFNRKHNLGIEMRAVEPIGMDRNDLGRFGFGTLLRLTIDQYLPETYQRVLYLDADVLVFKPLDALLSADLHGRTAGAVPDIGIDPTVRAKAQTHRQLLGLQPNDPYFNAGVMLFDWPRTLKTKLLPRSIELLGQRTHWKALDQDVLNITLKDDWWPLDYVWNATGIIVNLIRFDAAIRHFTASEKPWSGRRYVWQEKYWRYYRNALQGTGWEDIVERRTPYLALRGAGESVRRSLQFGTAARVRRAIARPIEPSDDAANRS